jgi:hypothetical protein
MGIRATMEGTLLARQGAGDRAGGRRWRHPAVAWTLEVRRQLAVAGALIVAGVADTFIATYILIPAFAGGSGYYWAYTALGKNVPQAIRHRYIVLHRAALRTGGSKEAAG